MGSLLEIAPVNEPRSARTYAPGSRNEAPPTVPVAVSRRLAIGSVNFTARTMMKGKTRGG